MGLTEKEKILKWIQGWKKASPKLEEIRRQEIQNTDTKKGILTFTGMLFGALKQNPPKPWSGLIEQQKLFQKLRHAGTR